jgi:rubrerythrin
MKYNILYIECISCGTLIFPPKDVSDIGIESYEERYEVPSFNPKTVPTLEDLDSINKVRQEQRIQPYKSIDDWLADYKEWVINFRNDVKSKANSRLIELNNKILDAQIIEEDEAIRIIGKRYQAVLEKFDNGWRLKCPNCGFTLVECWW